MPLSVDGALSQRLPPAAALPHNDMLRILADVHVAALQLLHSTLLAAKRHALPHAPHIGGLLRKTWALTASTSAAPPQFRCPSLRASAHALGATLLSVLGPCVAPMIGEPMVNACLADLAPAHVASSPDDDTLAAGAQSGQRKRAKGGSGPDGGRAAGGVGRPVDLAVRCAALDALQSLLHTGSDLLPLPALSSVQRALLAMCKSNPPPPPPLHSLGIAALHASVGTGRVLHSDVLPRVHAACHHAAVHGEPDARRAALAALNALDALAHPIGVLAWGAPPPEPAVRTATASAAASAASAASNAAASLGRRRRCISASRRAIHWSREPVDEADSSAAIAGCVRMSRFMLTPSGDAQRPQLLIKLWVVTTEEGHIVEWLEQLIKPCRAFVVDDAATAGACRRQHLCFPTESTTRSLLHSRLWLGRMRWPRAQALTVMLSWRCFPAASAAGPRLPRPGP